MTDHTVNLAIQVLPLHRSQAEAYGIIDKAIEKIKDSGLKYVVCPFETVIEGPYTQVMTLINDIGEACKDAGAESLLVNMKLHLNFEKDLFITDKTGKYTD